MHIDDPFEHWQDLSQEEQINTIKVLELQPERRLDALRATLKSSWKSRWLSAVQAIRAMGSPQNAAALPELLRDQIGERNAAGWEEAVQTVLEMPIEAVCEQIIWILWEREKTISSWSSVVEGICAMLNQVQGDYALYCAPILVALLSQEQVPEDLDKTMLLDILEGLPLEHLSSALPVFIDLAERYAKETPVGAQARSLIMQFDEKRRKPYQKILATVL